jgi:NTP pyrophosphatase (non-canonical NTP hydrolase)
MELLIKSIKGGISGPLRKIKMEIKQLTEFSNAQRKKLMKYYSIKDENELTYPYMLKITEEVGELAEALLALKALQREGKFEKKMDIGSEFADVILTTFILAGNLNINLEEELKKKMEKIEKRYK